MKAGGLVQTALGEGIVREVRDCGYVLVEARGRATEVPGRNSPISTRYATHTSCSASIGTRPRPTGLIPLQEGLAATGGRRHDYSHTMPSLSASRM